MLTSKLNPIEAVRYEWEGSESTGEYLTKW